MEKLTNPTDIARETLKQLALRRIVPSPDHYQSIYHEIAQSSEEERIHPGLRELIQALDGSEHPDAKRQLEQLKRLIKREEWQPLLDQIIRCYNLQHGSADLARNWADLIKDLILQWDLRNPAYPPSRKREALDKVLINFGSDSNELNQKLSGLITAWGETGIDSGLSSAEASEGNAPANPATTPAEGAAYGGINWQDWRDATVTALELGLQARLSHNPDLQQETQAMAGEARAVSNAAEMDKWLPRLRKFWLKLELQNDQEDRLCDGLMRLLRLLTDNMAEIVVDDEWVRGQIAVVQSIMAQPLDMRVLYDAEAGLKEVLYKQSQVKHSLVEAQSVLKDMLATFIDRLSFMSESTDTYHEKISGYAEKITVANDLTSIRHVMEDLLQDTRSMQLDVMRSRDELREARKQADLAHSRVVELEKELTALSDKVREDQLTGALNRRGLEDAYQIETSRALRSHTQFAVALLDIDNFKKLNDGMGHAAGDAALKHLVAVVKDLLRPTDTVARYGGEEFVVLMPDTNLAAGTMIMQRVQRELTKRFFMHDNEKVLITFSAGITLAEPTEARDAVLKRADEAMYRAKKNGKNRVEQG